jgi:hypothetical protein
MEEADHARSGRVSNELVNDIPRRDVTLDPLDLGREVLRDDILNEAIRSDVSWEPSRGLLVPERIVPETWVSWCVSQ